MNGIDRLARRLAKRILNVEYPKDFPWKPFKIFKLGRRLYGTDHDIGKYRNPGAGKTYFVSLTGISSNDGLSWSSPIKLFDAIQKPDVDKIIVGPGVYNKDLGFNQIVPTRNIAIIGIGKVVLSNHAASMTWSATAGYTNVWQVTRTLFESVYDASQLDGNGDYARLTSRASIADVDANPGSYYFNSATNVLYVKTSDQRQPDANVRVYVTTDSNKVTGNVTVYMENIWFEGGANPFLCNAANGYRPTVIAKNCKFKYGGTNGYGCFSSRGAITHLIDCEASKGEQDGFNYHVLGGLICHFTEQDCIGRDNGLPDDNNNGSSAHDAAIGIRVNGKYYRNKGPNVIDINDGTVIWCVGTEAYDSVSTGETYRVNFGTAGESSTRSKMYLYDCYSHGTSKYDIRTDNYGHILMNSCEFTIGANITFATDILDAY